MSEEKLDLKARRGGRGKRRALRTKVNDTMLPNLKRNMPLVEPMNQEQIEKIDDASMSILEEVGVIFRDDIAIDDWKKAGAKVEGDLVKLDREMMIWRISISCRICCRGCILLPTILLSRWTIRFRTVICGSLILR